MTCLVARGRPLMTQVMYMKQPNPKPDRDDRTDETINAAGHDPQADNYYQPIRNFVDRKLRFAEIRLAETGGATTDALSQAVEAELMKSLGGKTGDSIARAYALAYLEAKLVKRHEAKGRLAATTSAPSPPVPGTAGATEAAGATVGGDEGEGKMTVNLNLWNNGPSKRLMCDLLADEERKGVRLCRTKHGRQQPAGLKRVLEAKGLPAVKKAICHVEGKHGVYVLDIPSDKINRAPAEN